MENIKKFLIFSIFIFSGIECLGKGAFNDAGKGAAKIIAPALVDMAEGIGLEAAQALAPALVDASKGIGSDAAKAFADSNVEIAKIATVLGGPAIVVAAVGVTIYGVTQLQPIVIDTYYFIYPTEEQQEKSAVAGRKVKYYKAEEKFVDCIINSKPESEINASGVPIDCEELARIFVACGGKNQVDKTIHDLIGFRK